VSRRLARDPWPLSENVRSTLDEVQRQLTAVSLFLERFSVLFDFLEPAIEIQSPLRQLGVFLRAIVDRL